MKPKTFTELKRDRAFNARVLDIISQNRAFLRESLTCFPPGPSHDYFMWGLNPENEYHKLFLEVSSMYNSAVLFSYIAESVIDNEFWPAYTHGISYWAGNGTIEPYTDNMAFHYLTNEQTNPSLYKKQVTIMSQFYETTIAKIDGNETASSELLASIRDDFVDFPFYQLHVNPTRSTRLLNEFIAMSGTEQSIDKLNEDGWAVCVANIDLVNRALALLDDHFLLPYLRERYRLRYEGQKILLQGTATTQEALLKARAPEIMVSYTLGYIFAATAVSYNLNTQLKDAHQSGLLHAILEATDILIRIMNDLGPLASASAKTTEAIFDSLSTYQQQNKMTTLAALFENWSEDTEILPFFTIRLKKDLTMGEDNIARDYRKNKLDNCCTQQQLTFMQNSIVYYAKVYQEVKRQFEVDLATLTTTLGSPIYAQLAYRFVNFHEQIYGNNYQGLDGEYAV